MKDIVIELEFTEEERSAIQGRLSQKVNEALNPNLADQELSEVSKARSIALVEPLLGSILKRIWKNVLKLW